MCNKILNIIKKSAIFLLLFFVIILCYTVILWIFRISINKYNLPIEFGISVIIFMIINYILYCKNSKNNDINKEEKTKEKNKFIINIIISILLGSIIFTAIVYCNGKIYDTTADGNSYHKLAVGSMKNGWIPLYESSKDYTAEDGNVVTVIDGNRNYLWVDHYAIGTEIIGSNIYAFTNNIESGKAFNLTMMYICFAISLSYLIEERKTKKIKAIFIAFILAINPITITQMFTYYVDTTMAMSLFIIFIELISLTNKNNIKESIKDKFYNNNYNFENYSVLAMSIAICANAKFTGLAYAGVFCLAFYIYWIIKDKKEKNENFKKNLIFNTIFFAVTLIITVVIIGGSSYLLNFIKYKSPFYPLSGEGHVENMVAKEIPESLSARPKIIQFLTSIFAKGENVTPSYYTENIVNPTLKIPFTMSKIELKNYIIPDIRMGGFGPLFSGIFIISTATFIIVLIDFIKNKKYNQLIQYLIITIISTVMVFALDGGYWARYVPYIYFITVMNLVYLLEKNKKYTRILSIIMVICFTINSLSVLCIQSKNYISNSKYIKTQLVAFKNYAKEEEEKGNNQPIQIKLIDIAYQGVEYNVDDLKVKFEINQSLENAIKDGLYFKY